MTSIRLPDDFYDRPSSRAAGVSGRALFVAGLCYCNANGTRGHIIEAALPLLCAQAEAEPKTADLLADLGLWVDDPDGFGFLVPQFHLYTLAVRIRPREAIPLALRADVYARDGYRCVQCGATDNLSLDHVWPWSLGGESTYENLQTLCMPCNQAKSNTV